MPWAVAGIAVALCIVFGVIAFKRPPLAEAQATNSIAQAASSNERQDTTGSSAAVIKTAVAQNLRTEKTVALITIDGMSYDEGKTKEFPYTLKWTTYQVPKTPEAKSACKEIISELKQISKALELGITYNRFLDLLQDKALTIEKIKDRVEGLPSQFLKHADRCVTFHKLSRDFWKIEIESSNDSDGKAQCGYERSKCWSQAGIELLYCVGIAEDRPEVSDLIMVERAGVVHAEEGLIRPRGVVSDRKLGLKTSLLPHPVLTKMTTVEILARFKTMAAAATELAPDAKERNQ